MSSKTASLFITEQGAKLRTTGKRLVIEKDGRELLEIECFRVATILIYGNVHITTPAISKLLREDIELAFLSTTGRLKGQLTPPASKNVLLRMAQYKVATDPTLCLAYAKEIVERKLKSATLLIDRLYRNHPDTMLERGRRQLRSYARKIEAVDSIDSLRGVEGAIARAYFRSLSAGFRGEFEFSGRNRRPPTDPVNALLSFSYTLVASELSSLLDAKGFDPYVGFYHQIRYGRPSLALDLLEEFRCSLVDRFVLRICNLGQLKPSNFQHDKESGGIRLKKDAVGTFFTLYQSYLNRDWSDPLNGQMASPRSSFRARADELAKRVSNSTSIQPEKYGE